MIDIVINGEKVVVETNSLAVILQQRFSEADKYAVAVNEIFVPKAQHAECKLANGDRVELVMPMSGG